MCAVILIVLIRKQMALHPSTNETKGVKVIGTFQIIKHHWPQY